MSYNHLHTFNGSYGEIWIDDYLVAECTSCEATWEWTYEDITKSNKQGTYKKRTGGDGTGTLSLNKVNSIAMQKAFRDIQSGRQTESSIMIKIDDPDAAGMERVNLKHVNFDSIPLTGYTHKEVKKDEIPFTFAEWEPIDLTTEDTMTLGQLGGLNG